ncbi:MAG: hypothetical protein DWB99_07085 [Candidatus Poseidoniales archaeon]|nr:MAG: hypothetical protein DWB99_07085 [Candidatus Poseidoniales archaeon]
MSAEDGQGEQTKKEGDALVSFLLENRTLMNFASIIMIVYAVWATIEVITNAYGATWWPPETGIPADELFNNPDRDQNINNGLIIGLGAVCGTLGFLIQYFYRAAPYVDASMTATAALIIKQAASAAGVAVDAEDVMAKAEETAEAAATAAVEEKMAAVQEKVDSVAEAAEAAGVALKETSVKEKETPVETPAKETPVKDKEAPVEVTSVKAEEAPAEKTVTIESAAIAREKKARARAESKDDEGKAKKF